MAMGMSFLAYCTGSCFVVLRFKSEIYQKASKFHCSLLEYMLPYKVDFDLWHKSEEICNLNGQLCVRFRKLAFCDETNGTDFVEHTDRVHELQVERERIRPIIHLDWSPGKNLKRVCPNRS
jgi:hypothetical protein